MNKKVGIWIVLILTSLALVIPSIAIVYNLLTQSGEQNYPVAISSDDVKISVQTASPEITIAPVIEPEL